MTGPLNRDPRGRSEAAFVLVLGMVLGATVFAAIANGFELARAFGGFSFGDRYVGLLWAVGTSGALVIGCLGLFRALRTGELDQPLLVAFFLVMSVSLEGQNWQAEFVPVAASFRLTWSSFGIGANFLGLAGLWWYKSVINAGITPAAVVSEAAGSAGGADAV